MNRANDLKEFDCLSPEPMKSPLLFLEASAGTGKTFAIENIVVRLILGIDGPPVSIETILVVTFTKAATRELKIRVAQALDCVYQALLNEAGGIYRYVDEIVKCGGKGDGLKRLRRAISQIEMLQIFTIHGFCYRMLSEFSWEAKELISDSSGEEELVKPYLFDAIREVPESVFDPVELKILMRASRGNFKKLLRQIESMMVYDAHFEPPLPFMSQFEKFRAIVSSLKTMSEESIRGDIALLMDSYRSLKNRQKEVHPHFATQVDTVVKWLTGEGVAIQEYRAMLEEKVYFFEIMTDKNRKKGGIELEALANPSLLALLQEEIFPSLAQARDPDRILLRLVALIHPAIKKTIDLRPGSNPDALLSHMGSAVENSSFAEGVRSRFACAIVDEFQDTDALQWKIIERLFLDEHPNLRLLALIGDPKQSIYAFRNADIAVYRQAQNRLGSDAHYALATNFRSDPQLMEAINAFLGEGNSLFSFNESEAKLEYRNVKPALHDSQTHLSPHFHLCLYEGSKGRSRGWPSKACEEDVIFPHIAREIIGLRDLGVPLQEIVVLIRDRHQARRLQQFFEGVNIPSYSSRTSSLAKTKMYRFFLSWLAVLESPLDDRGLKECLSDPLFGLDHIELLDEAIVSSWQQRFVHLKELVVEFGLARAIGQFTEYDEGFILKQLVSTSHLDDYADFFACVDIILKREAKRGASILEISRDLAELYEEDPDLNPEVKRELIQDGQSVQIMTTHMSKGLEFEVVFALGTASRSTMTQTIYPIRSDEGVHFEIEDKKVISKIQMDLDAEKLRQLYVAITRPKRRLYVYGIFDSSCKPVKPDQLSPIELFFLKRVWGLKGYDELEQTPLSLSDRRLVEQLRQWEVDLSFTTHYLKSDDLSPSMVLDEKELELPKYVPLEVSSKPTKVSSFSHIAERLSSPHMVERQIAATEDGSLLHIPSGAEVGTIIHSLFETIIDLSFHHPYDIKSVEQLVDQMISNSPLDGYREQILKMIHAAFHTELMGHFVLSDVPRSSMIQEVEFIYREENGQLIKGFIDLLIYHEDRYYILDWKSNFLGDTIEAYDPQGLESAMKEHHYDLQAAIYAEALKRNTAHQSCEFGGAVYLFLRGLEHGKGIYTFMPTRERIDSLRGDYA